jgi:hypothetical protein
VDGSFYPEDIDDTYTLTEKTTALCCIMHPLGAGSSCH